MVRKRQRIVAASMGFAPAIGKPRHKSGSHICPAMLGKFPQINVRICGNARFSREYPFSVITAVIEQNQQSSGILHALYM